MNTLRSFTPPPPPRWCARAALWLLLGALLCGTAAWAQQPPASAAAALQARRQALQPQLQARLFGEPLVLSSRESADRIEGAVHAEMAVPLSALRETFRSPGGLCELLFLHLNVRGCSSAAGADGPGLSVLVGPKRASAPGSQYRMRYAMRVEELDDTYLRVTLSAAEGPLSTRDYRMVFEVVAIDSRRSFLHVSYAYGYGTLARMAMGAYLATAGRSKIGFTVLGRAADGQPTYVQGERAAIERNVMRYQLALQAHHSVTTGSSEERLQARLKTWFALTERHAAQLHEYGLAEYLQEKRSDLASGALVP